MGGERIDYSIEGEHTEVLRVRLDPESKKPFYGIPSNMVYIKGDVDSRDHCMFKSSDFLEHRHNKEYSCNQEIYCWKMYLCDTT